jgi:hypothetical protein
MWFIIGGMNEAVLGAIHCALEASIFQAPRDPGLSSSELQEVLRKLDFKEGEINDGVSDAWKLGKIQSTPDGRWFLDPNLLMWPMLLGYADDNYPANPKAVDFPISHLRKLQRDVGRDKARISRSDLVATAMRDGISQLDMEVAITLLEFGRFLRISSDIVELEPGREQYPLYSAMAKNSLALRRRPVFDSLLPIVSDTIRRRQDGRLPSAEPLVSFESVLEKIGHKNFSVWWHSTTGELSTTNPLTSSKSYLLLSAAVCEAMLALVATLARDKGLSMLKPLENDPRKWKLVNLIEAACSGPKPIIADPPLRAGLMSLNSTRQQIHVGALLSQYKDQSIVPDVKQEDARLAKEYTDKLGRRLLDWFQENGLLT